MARAGLTVTTPPHAVQVVTSTWARDSHDLFDFEAHPLLTQTFTVSKSMVCVRNGTEVQMVTNDRSDREQPPAGGDPLLRLVQRDGAFWVDRATSSGHAKKLWLVVRDLPTASHRLAEGDVMKLGRFKFRVHQLALACGGAAPELRLDDFGAGCSAEASRGGELQSACCRICLLEGPGEDDPLIAPCRCRGSIEHVHLGCLRHWIRGRLNFPEAPGSSYFYRALDCELCKAIYPTYVHSGHERTPLVEIPGTRPPFIVLENMVRDSQQHSTRGLHVISLAEKALTLGRGHESDVRIADVSISRCHATIRFQQGHFLLDDNQSKFGTLVAMKRPRLLEAGCATTIQMGRTVLSLSAQMEPGAAGATGQLQVRNGHSSAPDERALRLSLLWGGGAAPGAPTPPDAEELQEVQEGQR
mmetsp:Transcript_100229/g.266418  ORF Transcript_100229/g.266418 Transcript_100229/m.266418 type:complete len:414 (-) Transcript_100229:150-1391(-)